MAGGAPPDVDELDEGTRAGRPRDDPAGSSSWSSPCCSAWSPSWASSRRAGGAAETLEHLDEWGLGGRKFGAWITWFLIGGDIYTAYTFVAVPALLFGAGALGFYALPYTVVLYPLVFLPVLRMWSVSRVHGYVTPADFVRGRYGSPLLALLVAITGLVATMPYIALQLVGMEAVLRTMGLNGHGHRRAPAAADRVRDPRRLHLPVGPAGARADRVRQGHPDLHRDPGGRDLAARPARRLGAIFGAASDKLSPAQPRPPVGRRARSCSRRTTSSSTSRSRWARRWRCSSTRTRSPASWPPAGRNVIKRNMMALPAYSLLLGLLALLGYVAIAAGSSRSRTTPPAGPTPTRSSRCCSSSQFNSLFAGIAFAAIGIGALVPAAIMSIAAANLWTRNIYKEYLRRDATPAQEARQAKLASLVVKFGAVLFIIAVDPQFSIDLQLIGGVIILQTLPAVAIALYTRWLHRWALVAGWVVGMGYGMYLLYLIPNPAAKRLHFGGSALALDKLTLLGWHPFAGSQVQIYVGFVALVVNLVVAVVAHPAAARPGGRGRRRHGPGGLPRRRGVAGPAADRRADRGGRRGPLTPDGE